MRNLFLAATLILLPLSAAATDPNLYGRIDTGYSWATDSDGSSAIVGAGLGYKFTDNIRADVTLGYRGWYKASASTNVGASTVSGNADTKSFDGFANVYYDIGHFGRFTPYIGAGAGFANNRLDTASVLVNGVTVASINSNSRTDFAWQAGVGTAYQITDAVALDVGYRYVDLGKISTGDTLTINGGGSFSGATVEKNLNANEIQVGLRIAF